MSFIYTLFLKLIADIYIFFIDEFTEQLVILSIIFYPICIYLIYKDHIIENNIEERDFINRRHNNR